MQLEAVLKNVLSELHEMVKTETVVGEPIQAGDSVVIPVSKVSVGFGGGGGVRSEKNKEGKDDGTALAGGATIEPVAFIVIANGKAQLLSLTKGENFNWGKVVDLIPDLLNQVKDLTKGKGKKAKEKEKE
ncbi:putative spore protein YtfJ [bacterium BMS3Abin05]|nr:putative spore protein YtfJ [bacterium BMS3Abin05]GBE28323.1 putative spore protein YtfJ [bacterium BMS3Bbin03]